MNTPEISKLFRYVMNWKLRASKGHIRPPNPTASIVSFGLGCFITDARRLLATGMLLSMGTAFAGLPQPMCVYYGQALDGYGWPYTTNTQVALLHGTDEIASQTITGSLSPGVNFALYVHLDDGRTATPYSPRALHSGV